MSEQQIRIFGYNYNSVIPPEGTENIGNLIIQSNQYQQIDLIEGINWYNGPTELEGFIIAGILSNYIPKYDNIPTFWRSTKLSESHFVNLFQRTFNVYDQLTGDNIKIWLNNNGYWTNWIKPFIFTIIVQDYFIVPIGETGTYNFLISYGDNSDNGHVTPYNHADKEHYYETHETPSRFNITITGTMIGGWSPTQSTINTLINLTQWGCFTPSGETNLFAGFVNTNFSTITDTINLTQTTTLEGWFDSITGTTINNIENWNTSGITNMNGTFKNCPNLDIDLSNWNVSSCTNMSYMFKRCSSLRGNANNFIFSSWDTSNVTSMCGMFVECTNFNADLSRLDFRNIVGTGLTEFLDNTAMSDSNYDSLLNNIYSQTARLQYNVTLTARGIYYTSAGENARINLAKAPYNWTIIDNGLRP